MFFIGKVLLSEREVWKLKFSCDQSCNLLMSPSSSVSLRQFLTSITMAWCPKDQLPKKRSSYSKDQVTTRRGMVHIGNLVQEPSNDVPEKKNSKWNTPGIPKLKHSELWTELCDLFILFTQILKWIITI